MKQRIYGIGVDVAFISRFQKTFEQFGERFLKRAYHPKEIEEFYSRPDPQRALYLASR
jgi:phosphopantetheine--protein transferase-like protein